MFNCERCGSENMDIFIFSRFNEDRICLECEKEEKAHPEYSIAILIELEQVKIGNMNYNYGLPSDLRKKYGK